MNVFELTRALVDIDSVTPNEEEVGVYLADYLRALAERTGGHVEILGPAGGDAIDAHGHGASVLRIARG
jgi:acetylornithine deacetylase/succinyl-diaminopimelate desuccinylase-like protein